MTKVSVSSAARRRIRSFSVWVWVFGSAVLFVFALNTFGGGGNDALANGGDEATPWNVEDPPVFEPDGTTYSGEGGGVIMIPLEDHDQDPYLLVGRVMSDYVSLSMSEPEDLGLSADDRFYPTIVGGVLEPDDEMLLLPPDSDLELWVDTNGRWEFTLKKTPVTEITGGFASGVGNDTLVYRGDAASARFVSKGTGDFSVSFTTLDGPVGGTIYAYGEADVRQSWPPSGTVYFSIESEGAQDAWSVDIDELATDAPTPDPQKGTR